MNRQLRFALVGMLIAIMSTGMAGCRHMSSREQNTVVGAGIGAVSGSVLTGGSTAGTIGGAVVGGFIGSEVDYHHHHNYNRYNR